MPIEEEDIFHSATAVIETLNQIEKRLVNLKNNDERPITPKDLEEPLRLIQVAKCQVLLIDTDL